LLYGNLSGQIHFLFGLSKKNDDLELTLPAIFRFPGYLFIYTAQFIRIEIILARARKQNIRFVFNKK